MIYVLPFIFAVLGAGVFRYLQGGFSSEKKWWPSYMTIEDKLKEERDNRKGEVLIFCFALILGTGVVFMGEKFSEQDKRFAAEHSVKESAK